MADSDIEIQKFYEVIRSLKSKFAFLEQQVSTISALNSGQTLNNIDNARFNTHQGNGNIHYPKSAIRLNDLGDMTETSVADLELLSYDLTNLKWINRTPREAIQEIKYFNGTFLEKFHARVTSAGGVITLTLTEVNGANLTMVFSDGHTTLDVTPGATIVLTAGASDAAPQANYIYILQSGKVLAKDTTGWPAAEHIKVDFRFVPTAVFVQNNNTYIAQNHNDGTDTSVPQGHGSDQSARMRLFGAQYFSGVDHVVANNSEYLDIAAGNVEFKSQAGVVWQMHEQAFGAVDTSGSDLVLVKNWNGDAYHDITDLFDIVDDSAGVALNNKWFTLVIWGVANKTGEQSYIMVNLPSGSYSTQAKATEDGNNYTDFSIPRQFNIDSSTGFLIAAIVVKKAATWLFGSTKDLRGIGATIAVAGGTGSGITDHGSLTGLAVDDHTQYMLDSVFGTITNTPDIDQDLLTTSSPTFASPIVSTALLPDIIGGADIGAVTKEFGNIFLADTKSVFMGTDADVFIQYQAANNFLLLRGTASHIVMNTGLSFLIKDDDDADVNLFNLNTSARTLELGLAADTIAVTHHGNYLLGGTGGDDERLRVPYLTGVPASVDNGSVWMEADGLHIYWNGAEKLVAGV